MVVWLIAPNFSPVAWLRPTLALQYTGFVPNAVLFKSYNLESTILAIPEATHALAVHSAAESQKGNLAVAISGMYGSSVGSSCPL